MYRDGIMYRHLPPKWIPDRTVGDEEILRLWSEKNDTYEIATVLGVPEHEVERRLHIARDMQKTNAEWNWPPEPMKDTK